MQDSREAPGILLRLLRLHFHLPASTSLSQAPADSAHGYEPFGATVALSDCQRPDADAGRFGAGGERVALAGVR